MMTKIEERKSIIASLKFNLGGTKRGIDKRIQYLKRISILYITLTILVGGIVLASIILEPLGFDNFKWYKMGLLTILSLSFVLRLLEAVYALKLYKHLKKISDKTDFDGIEKLNSELKLIIDTLNNRRKYNRIVIPLAIAILILALIQVLSKDLYPYWNYAKILVVLFFGVVMARFYKVNIKLTRNIAETEKYCS